MTDVEKIQKREVNIPYPEAEDLHLRFTVGACQLSINPGEGDAWVMGTYEDPSGRLPLRIIEEGGTVRVTTGQSPTDFAGLFSGVPRLNLSLGRARPYALTFETGASDSKVNFGGLPLRELRVKLGAGRMSGDFSAPNPESMTSFQPTAGAGELELKNLANANAAEMRVEGGAASYKLDFGGALLRDMNVRITTGVSAVEIRVPATTAAKISSDSLLGSLDIGDGFMKKEGAFWTEGALAGNTPELRVHLSGALGVIKLRAT